MKRFLLLACLLLTNTLVAADERIFYQPLNVDASLSPAQWQRVWQDSAKQGAHTVIVQWTAYGDADFGGPGGWLANSLKQAQAQGLKLVLGLRMDPAYYQRINELDSAGLATYWQAQLGQSLTQQQKLRKDWKLPVSGWYLPMELDDLHFLAPDRRQTLQRQLKDLAGKLDAPLHVSVFNVGKLAPQVNGQWLGELANAGIQVWWQDGAGTGRLSSVVRNGYASALPCSVGIVQEAFRQVSAEGQPFKAEPVPLQAVPTACHPTAVFSLRYRPWGKVILDNQHKNKASDVQNH
ncbi:DUF4434 family protein [Pseudomonas vancouverensis]|uniref:DUF4434 family protein n=1 Tax=Pseudomonas vancouverensis TaxID=95300 RepID=A0A1H2N603_PSEVA|nr:DUF4434 family protein [Pseudomonas vancouverensis]KAB0495931.1 DUF4434 family protein [Pseudomonas vancouverensis]TDB65733.1 DUF4434 family protein [Pseudomonas vancouverensis]SDV00927.1 protein of unknown function [Pseudomonas vancouverensis]